MSKIIWDDAGNRLYETGVEQLALYVMGADGSYEKGVAWNGVTAITESPSGAESTPLYADNTKYLELKSVEEFGATIEAYTYPDEFAACDGSAELVKGVKLGQQPRKTFGLVYKTKIGNDTEGDAHGYKLHIIYGAKAAPSEKAYATVNDSPEAITFSWEITTTPVQVEGHQPTSHIEIDSTKLEPAQLEAIEGLLYGTEDGEATLPTPAVILSTVTGANGEA